MKPQDLLSGFTPMKFGKSKAESPLLRWLMVRGDNKLRLDTAMYVFDSLVQAGLLRYDKASGNWCLGQPSDLYEDTPASLAPVHVVRAIFQKMAGGQGKGDVRAACPWTDFATILQNDGLKPGLWRLWRAVRTAEASGWLIRLAGRQRGYRLTDEGVLAGREQYRAHLAQMEFTPAEIAQLCDGAELPEAPAETTEDSPETPVDL